jgi:outer membrane receptor protein involved in Fe transport
MRNPRQAGLPKFAIFLSAIIVCAQLAFPQEAKKREAPPQKEKARTEEQAKKEETKKKEEQKKKEEEERSKLFKLDNVTIDVIEYVRNIEIPNMNVVKTELFPMSIATTLDTALERQPGVDVQRIQEVGTAIDDDSIRIRGMGARRIQVRRDGRQLNAPGVAGGYFIDWTMIPLFNVDRVEVIKGVGDARYGNVLGGVVNLVPKRLPADRPATEVLASGASYETLAFDLYHAFKPGRFDYSVSAGLNRSDGYLWNGRLRSGDADVRLGYDLPFGGRLTADVMYAQAKKGFIVANRTDKSPDLSGYFSPLDSAFPASDGEYMYGGMGPYPSQGSYWKKEKWLFDFDYTQNVGGRGLLYLRYWFNRGNRDAYNTRFSGTRVYHKEFFDDRSSGLSASFRQSWGPQTITAGVDYNYLKDDGDKNYPDDFRAPFRNGFYVAGKDLGIYVMDEIRLPDERWVLTPGLRYLSYKGISGPSGRLEGIPDIEMGGLSPSVKLTFNYQDDSLIYLSVARALRMPQPPEYYWHYSPDAGVLTSGLPFHEEDGFLIQGGWRATLPDQTRIEVSPYYYSVNHYIQFDLINFISYNIDEARIYGAEFEVAHPFSRAWSAFLNYTFQKSRTEGDTLIDLFLNPADFDFRQVPGLPAHKLNAGVRYRAPNNASVALYGQFVSEQNVIYNDNTIGGTLTVRRQKSYVRLDVEGHYPLLAGFEVNLFVRNILDTHYQERFGVPAAGRNFGLAVRMRI